MRNDNMVKCFSLYEVIFNILLFIIYIYFVVTQFWYSNEMLKVQSTLVGFIVMK